MSTDIGGDDRDTHVDGDGRMTCSVIDSSTAVDGTMTSATDLRIDGQVSGAIQCEGVLYISHGAVVDATVEAGGIVVEGSLSGTILCHGLLEIRATGHVNAEVETHRLMIHEGAVYEGRLRMEAPVRSVEPAEPAELNASDEPEERSPADPYPYLRSFSASSASGVDDDRDLPGNESDSNRQ